MNQLFSKPDRYIGLCGSLRCAVMKREITGAPGFLRGTRLLFITDIHASARTTEADLAAFAKRVADIGADLILYGGDFADRAAHATRLFRQLAALKPPQGSFAAPGNNDAEAWPDLARLREALAEAGIRLLVNASADIALNGGTLTVAGVDEHRYGRPDADGLYDAAASDHSYRVLISHYPIPPRCLPDLMLCGHTHGGQFNLLGVTPFTIGFERLLGRRPVSRFISGLHALGGARVLVSKGIGASRIPLRAGVRPEIELIEFTA